MPELGSGDIFMLLKGLSPDAMAIAMGFYALAAVANFGMNFLTWLSSRRNNVLSVHNGTKLDDAKAKLEVNTALTSQTAENVNGKLSTLIAERDTARTESARIGSELAILKAQLGIGQPPKLSPK